MVAGLISLVIYLVVVGLILWLVDYVAGLIPLPPPFHQVIHIVIMVVGVLFLIYLLLGFIGEAPSGHLRLP